MEVLFDLAHKCTYSILMNLELQKLHQAAPPSGDINRTPNNNHHGPNWFNEAELSLWM